MPVDLEGWQAERAELFRQRLQVGDLPRRAESLKSVQVHQQSQILEPLCRAKISASQRRALVPLAVGGQAEDPAGLAFEPLGQREPGGQGEPVPQAAGGKEDLLDARSRRMPAEPGAILVERARSWSVSFPSVQSVT